AGDRLGVGVSLDGAAAEGGGRSGRGRSAGLSVVDDGVILVLVPDLDAEQVRGDAAVVLDGHQEAVVAGAVDGAGALVLGLVSGEYQPVVADGVEVEVGSRELELRVTRGHGRAGLVLGVEAEGRLAG